MKILVAPLNWGLGHATRCVPLIRRFIAQGDEVILGGDGDSLLWLHRCFPELRIIELAHLDITYSSSSSQVVAMLRALPQLIRFSIEDHYLLDTLLRCEHFDWVVSDNRFGLFSRRTACFYITHQLSIRLPRPWRWLEPLARVCHARIYKRYREVWVPDYEDSTFSLSGDLGHPKHLPSRIRYIGPQSRFIGPVAVETPDYDVVCVLSGPEPQRSLFEDEILSRFSLRQERVLLVRGRISLPPTRFIRRNITVVPYLDDDSLVRALCGAQTVIARSGYTSVMDFERLDILSKTEWHPTPGQSEQEYLAQYLTTRH